MHFLLVMAVLAALVIAENSPAAPVAGGAVRVLVALLAMGVVPLFAAVSSGAIARQVRREGAEYAPLLRQFRRLRYLHHALWLAVAVAILYWLDWPQVVRFNWHLQGVVLLDELLILAPVLLPLVLSWGAFYEVERALQAGGGGTPTSRGQYLLVHVRHYLGVLLVPVLGLLAVQDVAELVAPGVLRGPYALAVYLPPLGLMAALFPSLLRRTWQTSPLPAGPLRERLEAAARRCRFRAREILVWHTGGMVVNAAVAGFVPGLRYVFLTDALLERLTPAEIEAVFGHEMGHVRHRHLLARVLAMFVPISLWLLLQAVCPQMVSRLEAGASVGSLASAAPLGLAALGGLGLYVWVVFGAYSRILEAQADLFGYRTASPDSDVPGAETFVRALEKLAAANGLDRQRASWQHASVAQRVELVRRAAANPRYERRLERRLRLVNQAILALVLSPAVVRWLLG